MENQLIKINKPLCALKFSQIKRISTVKKQGRLFNKFNKIAEDTLGQIMKFENS